MTIIASPLATNQSAIPIVSQTQIGKFVGLRMHFPSIASFQAAVATEQANVLGGNALWADQQPMSLAGEPADMFRVWSVAGGHARTVVIRPGLVVTLAADSNVVLTASAVPSGSVGNNGDICVNFAGNVIYTKAGGLWAETNNAIFPPVTPSSIVIGNSTPSVSENTTLTGNVLAGDLTGTLSVLVFVIAGLGAINAAGATVTIASVGQLTLLANGHYTFIPVSFYTGAVPVVTFQVTNGVDLKNATLAITVTSVSEAQPDSTSTPQGAAVTLNVLANDTSLVHGSTLTIIKINSTAVSHGDVVTTPNGTVTFNSDDTLTFTPTPEVTGSQTFSYTIDNGHGGTSVAMVAVNVIPAPGSASTPLILYHDCPTGPTGYPTATGENGLGGYHSIFGRHLFTDPSDVGTTSKVYIGGVEVANYRYAGPSKTAPKTGVQQITFQLGTLGNAAVGVALPITVVRGGTSGSNNNWTFTPSGGRVLFVSLSGDDSSAIAGDINHPWRNLQTVNNANSAASMGGMAIVITAGDQAVIRGGNWNEAKGFDNTWFRFRNFLNQGTPLKWIHFTAYPGPIGGNAIEDVSHVTPTGTPANTVGGAQYRGGIHGANSAYAGLTGDFIAVSNIHVASSADTSSDGCGINTQYSSGPWWQVNNECGPWPSAILAKAAGFSGHAIGSRCWGNWIHDMHCVGGSENHGVYIDSPDASTPDQSLDIDIGWNWIPSAPGGNGIQLNDNLGSASGGTWRGFKGITIHDNYVGGYAKYGLNLGPGSVEVKAWNNVFEGGAYAWVRLDSTMTGMDIQVDFNTAYNCDQVVSGSGNGQMLSTASSGGTGTVKLRANIMVAGPNTTAGSQIFANSGGTPASWQPDGNLYFGPSQTTPWTAPNFAVDTHGIFADPLFTNATTHDFSLQAGSPAIDSAATSAPTYLTEDIVGTPRPQGSGYDLGSTERVSTMPFVQIAPVISGTPRQASTSTIDGGTWGNGPITGRTYQWFTALTLNGTPTPIPGATSNSYTWAIADYPHFGGCQVTAINASGPSTKTVFSGAAVLANANAPAATTRSSITGTGGIGNVLTRVPGVWAPSSGGDTPTVTWVWQRNGQTISGSSNASTYEQVTADDSALITILESGANQWATITSVSSNTITVPHVPAAPFTVGTAASFSANTAPAVFTRAVQAGDVVAIYMCSGNNATYNLFPTDDSSSTYAAWASLGASNTDPNKGGWLARMFSSPGTVTITVPITGSAYYVGTAITVRGVDPAHTVETGDVELAVTASPMALSPGTTANALDLLLAGWAGASQGYATSLTYSDQFVSSANDDSLGKQVHVQRRTTSSAGSQADMTFTWTGGSSGTNFAASGGLLKLRGF